MSRHYVGKKSLGGTVVVLAAAAPPRPLPLHTDEWQHADWFDWGRANAGAAQLAFALLIEHLEGSEDRAGLAFLFHDEFMRAVVSRLPESWCLSREDLAEFVGDPMARRRTRFCAANVLEILVAKRREVTFAAEHSAHEEEDGP